MAVLPNTSKHIPIFYSRSVGKVLFALQNGFRCRAADNFDEYKKHGESISCKNEKGGPSANDVYKINDPMKGVRVASKKSATWAYFRNGFWLSLEKS